MSDATLSNPAAVQTKPRRAPGPKGTLIWGNLADRRKRPLDLYLGSMLTYGDVVRFRMGPFTVQLVSDSELVKQILQDRVTRYPKGRMYEVLEPVLGKGLLTNDGESWRQQRKLAQPAFHRQRLIGFANTMVQETQKMLDGWSSAARSGQSFDVAQEMMHLTLSIVGLTLFSRDVSGDSNEVGGAVTRTIQVANARLLSRFPKWYDWPTPVRARFNRDKATLDRVVFEMIEARRKDPADHGDLLSMFMATHDEETGATMTNEQIRDEVMTIFLAGHETTANTLAWTWALLSQHPDVARKLRAELAQVLGTRAPTFEDVPKLKYAERVIQESMRLYPPAWIIAREAKEDDNLGGFEVPKGSFVVVAPYVLHRSPKYWKNPEGFDPDRFDAEKNPDIATRPKYAYMPFSGGPRVCIGNAFAMMEAVLILATVAQRFELNLIPGAKIVPEPLITLRPQYGVPVTLAEVERA